MSYKVYILSTNYRTQEDTWVPYEFVPEESGLDDIYRCLVPPYHKITIEYTLIRSERYNEFVKHIKPLEPI